MNSVFPEPNVTNQNRINRLHRTITDRYGCDSLHSHSVPLDLRNDPTTVWSGHVEVFDLIGHPTAARCFAWIQPIGSNACRNQVVIMPAIPPIKSPELAVQAYILRQAPASEARQ